LNHSNVKNVTTVSPSKKVYVMNVTSPTVITVKKATSVTNVTKDTKTKNQNVLQFVVMVVKLVTLQPNVLNVLPPNIPYMKTYVDHVTLPTVCYVKKTMSVKNVKTTQSIIILTTKELNVYQSVVLPVLNVKLHTPVLKPRTVTLSSEQERLKPVLNVMSNSVPNVAPITNVINVIKKELTINKLMVPVYQFVDHNVLLV